jgi:hypothetical protein
MHIRDVAQIDIPALLDVHTYGDRLLIVFDKGEMRRFIVEIYNSEVYTRTGLGQKPSWQKPPDKSPLDISPPTKSPPIMKSTSYLYIGIFAHILDLLYRYLWVNITFEYYFS